MKKQQSLTLPACILFGAAAVCSSVAQPSAQVDLGRPRAGATVPLSSVRLLDGPFADAVKINRAYLLAHDPDRLLAPFFREAGVEPKARPYGNWESSGLDGHTAGHYLSALATMIASGADTPEGELRRRLDYMVAELERCQKASPDGYLGGVPGSAELWKAVASGRVEAVNRKWVPWYNLHKMFAGLRDAFLLTGNDKARQVLIRLGDWCDKIVAGLSDEQMQRMLGQEHGGINETLADLYVISGDAKYLALARRFNHKAVLDPLMRHQDQLTGKHANTQIPKVVGLERIATLTGDKDADSGARYFWENVTGQRSVAFGGNSVSEHFNNPKDFRRMIESREGPETCNTYNMLRLTEQLFATDPRAAYADFYERALYNHILASIHPSVPGYVYFTPIRPAHYRSYSQPEKGFWCCVGTGMENPGRYGEFIYAQATNGLFVNLFIASELTATNLGLTLRQETKFPDEPRTRLTLRLQKPATFTLHVRHPGWVATNDFAARVNGELVKTTSAPSSYVALTREWRDGDRAEVELPMRTTVERLPDGSDWVALLRGPIVLVSPAGTNNMTGLRANDSRMGHVASGPMVPLGQVPVLVASADDLASHVKADAAAGPMRFRLTDVAVPESAEGLPLLPFFRLHDSRYQMYWQLTTKEAVAGRRERLAADELRGQDATAAAATPQQPGIEIVSRLEKPASARRLEEKDFGGYLMVYFKDQTHSAYMAISRDGYKFTDLNKGQPIFDGKLLAEQKGVRDPHIARGVDGGFYLAMTDLHIAGQRAGFRTNRWERPEERYGWGNNRALVLMKSFDLIHWTHSDFRVDKAFPELGDIDCSWAPETIYDAAARKMMVYFTIRYENKRANLYWSYTDDTFTKLETKPEMIPNIGGIDGDITKVGDKFHLFYVAGAQIKHAISDKINQGYAAESRRIDPNTVSTEAPNVFKRLGTDTYVLMCDVYGARPNNMGFSETTDFVTYKDIGRFNEGAMKGTNFERPKHGAVTYLTWAELKATAAHWRVDIKLD